MRLIKYIYILLIVQCATKTDAHLNTDYILSSESTPADANFLPTLGNGHLGYTVFGDAIYMNGIYNGRGGNSRRARIPNWLNVSVNSVHINYNDGQLLSLQSRHESYDLLLQDGYFRWSSEYVGAGVQLKLEQRTYPHRYHDRALIYELQVRSAVAEAPLILTLKQFAGAASEAFHFTPLNVVNDKFKLLRATTRVVEHERFQPQLRQIFLAFSDDLTQGKTFHLGVGEQEFYYRYIITIAESPATALDELQNVLALPPNTLLERHCKVWRKFWSNFNIRVENDLQLSQTINAGIFYLANSMPTTTAAIRRQHGHFGLSPTGLGRGQLDADYEGHSFWDTEIWMLPVVTQFNNAWAEMLLQYRLEHLEGAQYNANVTGYNGARFPWESAYTGTEVINPCCPEVAALQVHISADIGFALRQHYAVTHDDQWLCNNGWPLTKAIAEFLVDRVTYNRHTKQYHIEDVMGPDEDHPHVTDNVYTNVIFKLTLEFANFAQRKCQPLYPDANRWRKIAEQLVVLYDNTFDYHPQYLGYQRVEVIKQADVILLGYPLQYGMNISTRLNDLNTYAAATRESGPAMTWSMFTINYLDVGETNKANMYFMRSYKDYVRPEFKVWSENKIGFIGATNFITGVGGFLQAIINGYGGIRFYLENTKSVMAIHKPNLLPMNKAFTINGLKFSGAEFALSIKSNVTAILKCLSTKHIEMEFINGKQVQRIFVGFTAVLNTDVALVQTL